MSRKNKYIEVLKNSHVNYTKDIRNLSEKAKYLKQLTGFNASLYHGALHMGIKSLVVDNNFEECLKFFYIASYSAYVCESLSHKAQRRCDPWWLPLLIAVLSGDKLLLSKYSDYQHTTFESYEDGIIALVFRGLQAAINNDTDRLTLFIDKIDAVPEDEKLGMQIYVFVFKTLIERDAEGFYRCLETIANDPEREEFYFFAAPFVSLEATALLKLGFQYGLDPEVKHPLIMRELATYKPEEPYGSLPFLDFSEVIDLPDEERIARGYAFPWERNRGIVGWLKKTFNF